MVVALAFGCATGPNAAQPSGRNFGRDAAGRFVCDPDGCVPLDGEVKGFGTFFGEDAPHLIIHEGEALPDHHMTFDPYLFAFHMDVVDNFFITPPYVDVPEHFLIARGQPDTALFFTSPPSVWGYGINYGPTPMPGD